jgi:Tfp pilus assembly protein PilN
MKNALTNSRDALHRFLGWWWQELCSSLPRHRAAGNADAPPRMLRIEDETWQLTEADADANIASPRRIAIHQYDALQTACQGRPVVASLQPWQVHHLQLPFPPFARPTAEAIEYALLTHAPMNPETLLFDWQQRTAGESGGMVIEVCLCRRQDVEALTAQLAQAGITPAAIGFAPGGSKRLAHVFSRARRQAHRRLSLGWGVPLIVLLVALAVGARAHWQARTLERELRQLEAAHHNTRTLQREAAATRALLTALQALATRAPRSNTLNELARHLPTTAWLTEVRFEADQIFLIGQAQDPAAAARALAASPLLTDVRLGSVASVSSGATSATGASFEISAKVAPGS